MKKKLSMLLTAVVLVCLFCLPVSASADKMDFKSSIKNGARNVTELTPTQNAQTIKYTINRPYDYIGTMNSQYAYGVVLPVKVTSPGLLSVGMTSDGNEYVKAYLCSDASCSTQYSYGSSYLNVGAYKNSGKKYDDVYLNKAGTYYLLILNTSYGTQNATFNGDFTYRFTSSTDRSLKANQTVKSCVNPSGTYYKVSVPNNGYITLHGSQGNKYGLTAALYNGSKKEIKNTEAYLSNSNGYVATYKVNKGTYYIKVTGSSLFEYNLKYTFASSISASNNKQFTLTPANAKQDIYVKIKPNKTGYITVTDNTNSAYVTLCNKKQKAVSDKVYMSSSSSSYKTATFAVRKNETYYLKVNSYSTIKMKYAVKAVKDESGSKATKAKAIKKGKTAQGLIIAGENTADYYKVTLTKAQVLQLTLKGKASSGGYNVEVYSNKKCTSKYRLGSSSLNYYNSKLTLKSTSSNHNKLNKGTYYVKITRKNSKSNGYYSIKWN